VGDVVGGGARRGARATGVATGGGAPGGSFMGAGDASCSVRGSFTDADGRERMGERQKGLTCGARTNVGNRVCYPTSFYPTNQTKNGTVSFLPCKRGVSFARPCNHSSFQDSINKQKKGTGSISNSDNIQGAELTSKGQN